MNARKKGPPVVQTGGPLFRAGGGMRGDVRSLNRYAARTAFGSASS